MRLWDFESLIVSKSHPTFFSVFFAHVKKKQYFCGLKVKKEEIMLLQILKSKIHRVTVTEANLDYIGSITIDEALMEAANIYSGERVQVVDNTNGARLETYVIPGKRGSGCICMNGAAAHLMHVGDTVIIMAYALLTPDEARSFKPAIIFPNNNKLDGLD